MPITNDDSVVTTPESGLETVTTDATLKGDGTGTNPLGLSSTITSLINGKQDTLTFDSSPTEGSSNPVTSDGIYDYVNAAVTGAIHIVGTAAPTDMPGKTKTIGDTYVMTSEGTVPAIGSGTEFNVEKGDLVTYTKANIWINIGSSVDLTKYAKLDQLPSVIAGVNTIVTTSQSSTGATEYHVSVTSSGASATYPVEVAGSEKIDVTHQDTVDSEGAILLRTYTVTLADTAKTVVSAEDTSVVVSETEDGYSVGANLPKVENGTVQTTPEAVANVVTSSTIDNITTYSINLPKICVIPAGTSYSTESFVDGTLYLILDEE